MSKNKFSCALGRGGKDTNPFASRYGFTRRDMVAKGSRTRHRVTRRDERGWGR